MAPAYSDANLYPKFGSFVRAVIGLPYTSLKRLDEAIKILEKMAQATTGPRKKFCQHLLKYLYKTWLNDSIPRAVWNMYQHPGQTLGKPADPQIYLEAPHLQDPGPEAHLVKIGLSD